MKMDFLFARLREPSTWASLAATVALVKGGDPVVAADTVMQAVGVVGALAGVFLGEGKTRRLGELD